MALDIKSKKDDYQALLQLPKEKEILDFVWRKISETCGPDKSEMLLELLEMHRTSNGFDPIEISKGRVKRIKASEYKKVLVEINASISSLLSTTEYKEKIKSCKSFEITLANYYKIHKQFEKGVYEKTLDNELISLKRDLVDFEAYELLLSLYRSGQGFYESNFSNQDIQILMEEYNQVKLMAELHSEHTFTGLRTIQLVGDAENGNRNNQALVNLYDQLCKLLIRQSGARVKYETLTRIIRVSAHMENKKHYMEPYLAYTQTHFEEIVEVLPASALELNITLAVFLNREPLPVRLGYLQKAVAEAGKNKSQHELALFKIIHAELFCDGHDYDMALKILDEADYVISKMPDSAPLPEVKLRAIQTRFYIYALLILESRKIIEPTVFAELINQVIALNSKRYDIKIAILEMQAIDNFILGRFNEARNMFIKAAKSRENQSNPLFYMIDTFFQELLRKTPDQQLLESKINYLELLKETFYSTLWVKMLKSAVIKRELYGEVVL